MAQQISRDHNIADAQRGKQYLAKRSDIDNALMIVEALERGDWRAFVPILAVIVVFDNPGSVLLGPLQKLQPARGAHRHTQWKLVRWRYDRNTRTSTFLDACTHVETLIVD